MSSETSPSRPGPTRRTVLRGAAIGSAAWVTPVVIGVTAAPATAASPLPDVSVIISHLVREGEGSDPFKAVAGFGLNGGYSWTGSVTGLFTLTETGAASGITKESTVEVLEGSGASSISTDFGDMAPGEYTLSVVIIFTLKSYFVNGVQYTGLWTLPSASKVITLTV